MGGGVPCSLAPLPQPPHEAYESKTYRAEFYKGGAIGILKRQKGAKTLIYLSSAKHGETQLRTLADYCMEKLDEGDDEETVKAWGLHCLQ